MAKELQREMTTSGKISDKENHHSDSGYFLYFRTSFRYKQGHAGGSCACNVAYYFERRAI